MDGSHDCHVEPFEKPIDGEALGSAKTAYLQVLGMGCPRCAQRVENSLLHLDGVLKADVDLSLSVAEVAFNPQQVQIGDLTAAVTAAGNDGHHHYEAQLIKELT